MVFMKGEWFDCERSFDLGMIRAKSLLQDCELDKDSSPFVLLVV